MRETLREWEDYLTPYFNKIKLLSEIQLNRIECEQIGQLIRVHIQKKGLMRATRDLDQHYPRTFVTYLALSAAYNTEVGFWKGIIEAVGIPNMAEIFMPNHHWGRLFLEIIRRFNLKDFSQLGVPEPFVTAIRLHGGIPIYSLPDFFQQILLPSVRKQQLAELPSADVVQTMLDNKSVRFFIDAPVIYFLEFGSQAAVEFLDNCRRMARAYDKDQELRSAEEIGLPTYVVQTFQQYMEDNLEFAKGRRLRPWRLYLEPYGPDFYLVLPPEPVEGAQAIHTYYWEVGYDIPDDRHFSQVIRVRKRQRGYELQTEEVQIPIERPTQRLNIAFGREILTENSAETITQVLRHWHRYILPPDDCPPLAVFRYTDNQYCPWSQVLPAEALWLIYPKEVKLRPDGPCRSIEKGAEFIGLWSGWQVRAWDLSQALAVHLYVNDHEICVPIPIQTQVPGPILVGENILEVNVDPDGVPLYIGPPPKLHIPVRPSRVAEQETQHWSITIESRWAADPIVTKQKLQLEPLRNLLTLLDDSIELPLSAILGKEACGTYQVEANGPLGMSAQFRFRVWPEMELSGLQSYYLPTSQGAQPIRFSIKLPGCCEVLPQAGTEGLTIIQAETVFEIHVAPEVNNADLHLIAPGTGEPIRVPLSLPIPRLSWALPQGIEESAINWCMFPIRLSVDALLQSTHTTLHVAMPLVSTLPLTLTLHLVDPETGKLIQASRTLETRPNQTRWRFTLSEFFDALRLLDHLPVFEFYLEILDFQNDQQIKVPILRLNRTLEISGVCIESLEPPDFRLHWIESRPLRNRRVHIWSEWQPWAEPAEFKIPDTARGELLLVSQMAIPPSYYRIHFFTANPWEEKDPPPLPPPESHLVVTTTPRERLRWLEEKITIKPQCFIYHFERACVLEAVGDLDGREQEIQWCCRNLTLASHTQAVALYHWIGNRDPNTQKAIRIQMFRPENLSRMFQIHSRDDRVRAAYLESFPQTSLVKPETALLILEHDQDPARIMYSLLTLIKRKDPLALPKIIGRMENGQLSDADAEDLLATEADFSLTELGQMPNGSIKARLVLRIANRFPDQKIFVTTGAWIRSMAGWGCIDRIQDLEDGNEVQFFNTNYDRPLLAVTLRPDHHPETVLINLKEQTIVFPGIQNVYLCTKDDCNHFMSTDLNLIRNEHNRAAHFGVGPAFRPIPAVNHFISEVSYSLHPPTNQFV